MESVEYLIIGGGYAGDSAAVTLRKAGAKGRVMVVSAEQEYPYQRFTLSKDFLQGKRPKTRIYLHPPRFYDDQKIEVKLGRKAVNLNVIRREVTLDNGEELTFEKLLLATGAYPRKLPIPGAELEGVYYLRTLADSEAIKREATPGHRAVIIGGGFIGAEIASSLTQLGVKATIVDVVQTIWAHLFGEEMGRFFHEGLQKRGVEIIAPAHVAGIEGDKRVKLVATQEGHALPCDFVVIGVGVRPDTALAEAAGLKMDNGIVVNEYLETSEEGIFAAGDNARFFSPVFQTHMRIEHWDVAGQQGATAALNMLGQTKAFDQVPYFFSGLFDIWLEYLGYAPKWDRLTLRRFDPQKFTAFFSQGPHIKGALLVNNSRELQTCRALIARKAAIDDLTRLEDTNTDLGKLVPW